MSSNNGKEYADIMKQLEVEHAMLENIDKTIRILTSLKNSDSICLKFNGSGVIFDQDQFNNNYDINPELQKKVQKVLGDCINEFKAKKIEMIDKSKFKFLIEEEILKNV
jgi:hypothetical protein